MKKIAFVNGCGGELSREIFQAFNERIKRASQHDFIFVDILPDGVEMIGVNLLFTDTVCLKWDELPESVVENLISLSKKK